MKNRKRPIFRWRCWVDDYRICPQVRPHRFQSLRYQPTLVGVVFLISVVAFKRFNVEISAYPMMLNFLLLGKNRFKSVEIEINAPLERCHVKCIGFDIAYLNAASDAS